MSSNKCFVDHLDYLRKQKISLQLFTVNETNKVGMSKSEISRNLKGYLECNNEIFRSWREAEGKEGQVESYSVLLSVITWHKRRKEGQKRLLVHFPVHKIIS